MLSMLFRVEKLVEKDSSCEKLQRMWVREDSNLFYFGKYFIQNKWYKNIKFLCKSFKQG